MTRPLLVSLFALLVAFATVGLLDAARISSRQASHGEREISSNQRAVRERRQAGPAGEAFMLAKQKNMFNRTDVVHNGLLEPIDLVTFIGIITVKEKLGLINFARLTYTLTLDFFENYVIKAYLTEDTYLAGIDAMRANGKLRDWCTNVFTAVWKAENANQAGYLTEDVYVGLYTRAYKAPADIALQQFKLMDTDNSNGISLDEFLAVAYDFYFNYDPTNKYSVCFWGVTPEYCTLDLPLGSS